MILNYNFFYYIFPNDALDFQVVHKICEKQFINEIMMIFFRWIILFASVYIVSFHTTDLSQADEFQAVSDQRRGANIGFFSPAHVDNFAENTDFSMINVYLKHGKDGKISIDLDFIEKNFKYVEGLEHLVNLDLGPSLASIKPTNELNIFYINSKGEKQKKIFSPLSANKIRYLVSDDEIEKRLRGLPELIKKYRNNVGTIFICDEPFFNGISKDEFNRVIRKLRSLFLKQDLEDVKFGIIFAGAMFDADFAKLINSRMDKYVEKIDSYYMDNRILLEKRGGEADAFREWVKIIESSRLTTYDSAGNIYMGGGIPEEADVLAFDFYLSTLLQDSVHEETLNYYSDIGIENCNRFSGKTVSEIRRDLSFFRDGPVIQDKNALMNDRRILDGIFNCRMSGTLALLKENLKASKKKYKIMLIGESSANGLLEFDRLGNIESDQPYLLVEARMLDEVKRSFCFFKNNSGFFDEGLMFFLYDDTYDKSIDLFVSGAKGAKSVINFIYSKSVDKVSNNVKPFIQSINRILKPDVFKEYAFTKTKASELFKKDVTVPVLLIHDRNITLSATSELPDMIRASVNNGYLVLSYVPGSFGQAEIIVRADNGELSEVKSLIITIEDE